MIYFDNSATTKPYPEVMESYVKVSERFFGNPSSLHTLGKEAESLLDQARTQFANLIGVNKKEVIFTSGGTEGNNLAIKGTAMQHQNRGKHLITTKVEHASNLEAYAQLEQIGFEVTYLDVDEKGIVSLTDLEEHLREDTVLVSIIHVNNETGSIQPIKQIGELLNNYPKIYFHVDHVQGITKVPLSFKECRIDLCTISGHKFHGPKAIGALYIRQGVTLFPLLSGGVQEYKIRAGTENIPGVVAMTKALRLSLQRGEEGINKIVRLRTRIIRFLETLDDTIINSPQDGAPHILNFSLLGLKPEVVVQALTKKQIYVSTKSACSSKLAEPSKVLMAMGIGIKRAESALRVSFSTENTEQEVETFCLTLKQVVKELREVKR